MLDGNETDFSKMIKEALTNTSQVEGHILEDITEITETPWPTTRWHLELLEARDIKKHLNIGKTKP